MKTNGKVEPARRRIKTRTTELPIVEDGITNQLCDFSGYDADLLMKETAKLRKLITKRGTLRNPDSIMLYHKSC